jgi:hypothetical protein
MGVRVRSAPKDEQKKAQKLLQELAKTHDVFATSFGPKFREKIVEMFGPGDFEAKGTTFTFTKAKPAADGMRERIELEF